MLLRLGLVALAVVTIAGFAYAGGRIGSPDTDIGHVYPDQVPGGSPPDVSVPGDNGEPVEGCYEVEIKCRILGTHPEAGIIVQATNVDPAKSLPPTPLVPSHLPEESTVVLECEFTEVEIMYHPDGPPPEEPGAQAGWGVIWTPRQ